MLSSSVLLAFALLSAVQADTAVTKTITVTAAAPTATKTAKHNYEFETKLFFDDSLAQGPPLVSNTTGKVSDLFVRFIVSNGSLPAACPTPFNKSRTAGWTQMTYGIPWLLEQKNVPNMTNETYKIIGYQTSRPLNSSESLFHAGHGQGFMRYSTGGGELCGTNFPWQPRMAHLANSNCNDTYIFSKHDNTRCAVVTLKAESSKAQKTRRYRMTTVNHIHNKRGIQVSPETNSDGVTLLRLMETVAMEMAADITNTTLVNAKYDEKLAQGAPPHYKSYNTSSDLYIKAHVLPKLATECPTPFDARNTTGWLRMTYGIPWQHSNSKDNSTAALMWQMSRELREDEDLYHAGWGRGFMNAEAGPQCGTNYPYRVAKPKAGPLSTCTDLRVPLSIARCLNLVLTK